MNDPSTPEPPATDDLARLREQRSAWHIRRASEEHPGQLGYRASRDGILITAENLVRLGDRITEADRTPAPPAALMAGPAGWLSGPMPEMTIADVIAACAERGWQISSGPGPVLRAEFQTGTMTRLLIAHTPGELAEKIAAVERGQPAADPSSGLDGIAAAHPGWTVGAAARGHGVEAQRGDVLLWAYSEAELAALLDVADPRQQP
jgi:hypothetical protein